MTSTYNGSDHKTITFDLGYDTHDPVKYRPWDQVNWPVFTETLKKVQIYTPDDITDKKLDGLVDKIYIMIKRCCVPKTKTT